VLQGPAAVGAPRIIQTPAPGKPTPGLATTAPDQPAPTFIDHGAEARLPPPAPLPAQEKRPVLVYVVLTMAGIIGLLLALLLWALMR